MCTCLAWSQASLDIQSVLLEEVTGGPRATVQSARPWVLRVREVPTVCELSCSGPSVETQAAPCSSQDGPFTACLLGNFPVRRNHPASGGPGTGSSFEVLCVTSSRVAVAVTAQLWKLVLWPWGWKNRQGSQAIKEVSCPACPNAQGMGPPPPSPSRGAPALRECFGCIRGRKTGAEGR